MGKAVGDQAVEVCTQVGDQDVVAATVAESEKEIGAWYCKMMDLNHLSSS